ncbi:PP0621 family protein [Panacagrimonas sp.]|uniref:PP0621 family protein n=1 Tax=Panacagrimonas sp. TaxID=2480088 RepID=UPI003B52E48C
MGMLIRLLLIGAAIWLGVIWLRKLRRSFSADDDTPVAPPSSKVKEFQPMVRCRECGVHLPAKAVSERGLCGKCLR